ncbi:DUF4440 domain-containing protein [Streptomyces sp. NPDC050095]|uniref:nuclear transport factor 2 family protein n=1 Tax=unclassified Streptomyces TaxID=2593676 RepID=UPI0034382FB4
MNEDEQAQIQAAIDGELRLLDPAVRASDEAVRALQEPGFVEFGASGTRWDATSILQVTGAVSEEPEGSVEVTRMTGALLTDGVVHLTYHLDYKGRRSNRSSLWRRHPEAGWRLYFHQGTLTEE